MSTTMEFDYIPLRPEEVEAMRLPAAGELKTFENVAAAIAEISCRLARLEYALEAAALDRPAPQRDELEEQIAALRRKVDVLADQVQGDW
jgi:phage host-nuclease inhibitor protein Gam